MTAPGRKVQRVVIVGACYGGIAAATELRAAGFDGEITLLGAEPGLPYRRTHLSKECLGDKCPDPAPIRPAGFLDDKHIRHIAGARVTRIDRVPRHVFTADGARHPYDALILATGARARRLPDSIDPEGRALTLRHAGDVAPLCAALRAGTPLAIIGGGLIGMEVAAAARAAGCPVTVVEAAPRLMARSLYPELSARVLDHHRAAGVTIHLGRAVTAVTPDGLTLDDGATIPAGLVLAALGATPRSELAEAAGLPCPDGIATDATGRTAEPTIFALGDCALWDDRRHESVAAAQAQAKVVAAALLHAPQPAPAPLRMWSTQGSLRLMMSGPVNPEARVTLSPEGDGWLLRATLGDRLIAVQALDAPRPFGATLAEIDLTTTERAPV